MTKIFFILILGILSSCGPNQEDPSNDYVLIEFAAKVEEVNEKLEAERTKK